MNTYSTPTFLLDNFEGPLELLLYLIQKEEIDICDITIKNLTTQLIQELEKAQEVDTNSEALTLAASLLLLKSQKLLPQESQADAELEDDSRIEIIQSLIEYCQFKEMAKTLSLREETQKAHFPRAFTPFQKDVGLGLETMGIDHLKGLLENILKRSTLEPQQIIHEEEWQVASKLHWLQQSLKERSHIDFDLLILSITSRGELIVLFLALLEMMKHQEARVVRENEKLYIIRYDTRT